MAAVCWQSLDRNDWMRVPGEALARVVPLGDLAEPGQPGPFSLGSRDELLRLLADTGWDDVTVDGLTFPVPVGGARSLDDAVEFVRGGSLGRSALAGVSPAVERRALGAVRDALAPYATGEGVLLPGAAWLVRADQRRYGSAPPLTGGRIATSSPGARSVASPSGGSSPLTQTRAVASTAANCGP